MTSIQQRDAQSVLAGIDDLLPQIRERAQATEDLRRLPDETVQELEDVGFFTLLQPEQWGGLQCDPTLFYEAVRRLASACGSTGWVSSIIGVHNWHLALFDQQAQEEVWGEDPKTRVSSSYAPMGAGVVTDGGYLVNGSWNWSSGCDHATWAFLGGPGHQGRPPGRLRQLPDPAQRIPHRRRVACRRPARHRQQHAWWSRMSSCRGTGSCPTRR